MNETVLTRPTAARAPGIAGRYLTFFLGHQCYAIQVLRIREIIRLVKITAVPQLPPYVQGVINLRGRVIPVVDLRIKFGLAQAGATDHTCVIVAQLQSPSGVATQMGVIVDEVEEVVNIAAADIEETPDFGTQVSTDYLLGLAKMKDKVTMLLDINRILSSEAVQNLSQLSTELESTPAR